MSGESVARPFNTCESQWRPCGSKTHQTPMPIPELNEYGFLPVGTHLTSPGDIQERFVRDARREQIWGKVIKLFEVIQQVNAFQAVEFFGSFFSRKPDPSDIDLALESRRVKRAITGVTRFIDKDAMRSAFQGHVLVKDLNNTLYVPLARPNYPLTSSALLMWRRLNFRKAEERDKVFKVDGEPATMDKEYKGVLRVAPIG